MKNLKKIRPNAFSLIEVLIVVAVLSLLLLASLTGIENQRIKAEDVRIKTDLARLKIAFEDYRNDKNCYPPAEWFDSPDDCNSSALSPYLNAIPCNPKTQAPYKLEYPTDQCSGFRLYGTLSNTSDPALAALCTSSGGSTLGNYGVSSSNTTIAIDCTAAASPSPATSPTPTPSAPLTSPGPYACQMTVCNNFGTPNNCPVSFSNEAVCEAYCVTEGAITCNPL